MDLPLHGLSLHGLSLQVSNAGRLGVSFVVLYLAYQFLYVCYNAYLGPMSKFPGPKINAFSTLPRMFSIVAGTEATYLVELHKTYGPVVRTGPTELSYAGGAQPFKEIYGFKKADEPHLHKDPLFYNKPLNGIDGIITANDAGHARQRKILAHAFADKSLKDLQPMLKQWSSLMVKKLAERTAAGQSVDLLKYFNCTTFDIMGDLSFNEGLNMLEDGEYSSWVKTIFASIKENTIFRAIRMSSSIGNYLFLKFAARNPKIRAKLSEHWEFTKARIDRRLKRTPERPDLWSKLSRQLARLCVNMPQTTSIMALTVGKILEKSDSTEGLSLGEHHSIAATFMLAGTETTATALSGTVYHLLSKPEYLKKLTDEVRESHPSFDGLSLDSISRLKYLHAVLQEGLRMYPPVPTQLFRRTPKGGADLCGQWVPEDTAVAVHHMATYRNPELWKNPDEFHPERWLGDPEYKDDRLDALEPFSVGPRNCLGKNLAWHEMRLLLATVLLHFDLELCPESMDWANQKVYILWEKRPLMCKLALVGDS